MSEKWYVYIVECNDKSLYTGITLDTDRRIREHNTDNAKGAKYLRAKRPVRLVFSEEHDTKSSASKREAAIKSWKRKQKLAVIGRQV